MKCEKWFIQHDTSVEQRKYLGLRQESNLRPPEQKTGALSTELRELTQQSHVTEFKIMRQASCILLGSALSNSSWVVINEFWWWILSSERWIIQHDTSVGQRKYMSPRKESSPWPLEYMAGTLSTLSYENLWRARSFNWVNRWQACCILLGSAPSNSSWVVILSEFWWWILSTVMKCERWIMQHDTSVGSFTYILVSRIKLPRAELEGKSLLAYSDCCRFFVSDCPFGFHLDNKSIGCLFISDNIDWPQVK